MRFVEMYSHSFPQVDGRFANITPIGRYLLPRKRGMIASAQRRCGRRNARTAQGKAPTAARCAHITAFPQADVRDPFAL